jgi:hypothetical protein
VIRTCLAVSAITALLLLLTSAPARADLEIGQSFTGCTGSECVGFPPDTMGAVGEEHIVHVVNFQFRVFRKRDGALLVDMPDYFFWSDAGLPFTSPFDPRVAYDPFQKRWFVVAADFSSRGFLFAVSANADPTGSWTAFEIGADSTGRLWVDFPLLGFDRDGVFLAANMFDFRDVFQATSIVVLPKADLLTPTPSIASATVFEGLPLAAVGFAPQPAINLDDTGLPAPLLGSFFNLRTLVHFATITGPVTSPSLAGTGPAGFVSVPGTDAPDATQPDAAPQLETDSNRFSQHLVIRNGSLWGARTVGSEGRAAIQWIEFDAQTGDVRQSGLVSDDELDLFYPSIAVNEFDQVAIGFSGSSQLQFAGAYAVLGETSNGVTSFGTPVLLKAGLGTHVNGFHRNRWGDYSATVVDPSNPRHFWTFQEWADVGNDWATQITQLCVGPCDGFEVDIDIKPGSGSNPINPTSRGVIPVAILGSDGFDVANVDLTTLAFGPDGARSKHGGHTEHVNDDDFPDLVSHYRTQETGIGPGDEKACVSGETLDGSPFMGCEAIRTVGACGLGYEVALLLAPLLWRTGRSRPAAA